MAGPSSAFEQFLESFHAPRTDRRYADDFNLGALSELKLLERERAERLLIMRLRGEPEDDRIPAALAIVGTAASYKPLHDALDQSTGLARVRIADALRSLGAGYDPTPDFIRGLQGDFATRAAAIRGLATGPREDARGPLLTALEDPNFAVRIEAFEALLDGYALRTVKQAPFSLLSTIGMRLLSDLRTVAKPAASDMRDVIDRVEAGTRPDELGVSSVPAADHPALERVIRSLSGGRGGPWADDLDLEAATSVAGDARTYIENVALSELHSGDPRIPRALSAMVAQRAIEPLREGLAYHSGPTTGEAWVEAAKAALDSLT